MNQNVRAFMVVLDETIRYFIKWDRIKYEFSSMLNKFLSEIRKLPLMGNI